MSSIPANISRVSTLMASQVALANITRTSAGLLETQVQLSTGRALNRPSDDAVRASAIGVLDQVLGAGSQRARNLEAATTTLDSIDTALGGVTDLVRQAQAIASSQIGAQSDPATRAQQATVIDSIIRQLYSTVNRSVAGVHLFGGSIVTRPPLLEVPGGFRYVGEGTGLVTDLGTGDTIPITVGAGTALGETSTRHRSTLDLNPALTSGTRLDDVRGARGTGIARGTFTFSANGFPPATIDLSGADSVRDVLAQIRAAIVAYESQHSTTVLGGGGVTISGESIAISLDPGASITFAELGAGTTAADLGLAGGPYSPPTVLGAPLDPRLTLGTPLTALTGISLPLGSIRIRFSSGETSFVRDIDLSSAGTIDDVRNLIETGAPGTRVRIGQDGRGLDIFNEVSGPSMSIEEVPGGTTAASLGLRTISTTTPLSDFNHGRGVRVVSGMTNPLTGLVDRAYNTDFRITLGNGQWFDVDLSPADTVSVGALLARINAEFTAAIGSQNNPHAPPLAGGDFTAQLINGPNGLSFSQAVGPGSIQITRLNNSPAAEDLGLMTLTYDGASGSYLAQDRSAVRVNNLLTDLMDLRDALLKSDSSGITLAGESLGRNADRLVGAQALVGSYASRVRQAQDQLQDQMLYTTRTRSDLLDVDFAAAASRFSQLQIQLQASLQTTNILGARSLFDFLT
jgi:flagellin-like hook-associated protein FlgL